MALDAKHSGSLRLSQCGLDADKCLIAINCLKKNNMNPLYYLTLA